MNLVVVPLLCCVTHNNNNNNIWMLLCNMQGNNNGIFQQNKIIKKLTEICYRNKCMTDLSTCSTPNDTIHKVTTYIKLHRMQSCIPCTVRLLPECYLWGFIVSFTQVNLKTEKFTLLPGRCAWGVYHKFYPGKTDRVYCKIYPGKAEK